MTLSAAESKFLRRRRRRAKAWAFAGIVVVALTLALIGFLFWKSPLMINPYYVMERIEAGSLDRSLLLVAAMILPFVTLMLMGVLITLISVLFVAFSNERKFVAIIDKLLPDDADRSHEG